MRTSGGAAVSQPVAEARISSGVPASSPLHHLQDRRAHADEDHRHEKEEEPAHPRSGRPRTPPFTIDELGEEGAEGRRCRSLAREAGEGKSGPEMGRRRAAPRTWSVELGAEGPVDVARREEEDALRQAVVERGGRRRPARRSRRGPEPHRQDAHVLHGGVGQHPLEVALADHEHRGEGHGEEPQPHQGVAREGVLPGGAAHLVDAGEGEEGEVGDGAGEEPPRGRPGASP